MKGFILQGLIEEGAGWLIARKWEMTKRRKGFPLRDRPRLWVALRLGVFPFYFLLLSRAKPGLRVERDWALSLNLSAKRECTLNLDCTSSKLSNPSSMLFLPYFSSISSKVLEIFFFWLLLIKHCKDVNFFVISLKSIINWRNYYHY